MTNSKGRTQSVLDVLLAVASDHNPKTCKEITRLAGLPKEDRKYVSSILAKLEGRGEVTSDYQEDQTGRKLKVYSLKVNDLSMELITRYLEKLESLNIPVKDVVVKPKRVEVDNEGQGFKTEIYSTEIYWGPEMTLVEVKHLPIGERSVLSVWLRAEESLVLVCRLELDHIVKCDEEIDLVSQILHFYDNEEFDGSQSWPREINGVTNLVFKEHDEEEPNISAYESVLRSKFPNIVRTRIGLLCWSDDSHLQVLLEKKEGKAMIIQTTGDLTVKIHRNETLEFEDLLESLREVVAKQETKLIKPFSFKPKTKASKEVSYDNLEGFVEGAIKELGEIGEKGLAKCYENFGSYLYDFYPNLPWDGPMLGEVIQRILEDQRLDTIDRKIYFKYGKSIKRELEEALADELNEAGMDDDC